MDKNGKAEATAYVRMPAELREQIETARWAEQKTLTAWMIEAAEEKLTRTPGLPPGVDKEEAVV